MLPTLWCIGHLDERHIAYGVCRLEEGVLSRGQVTAAAQR